MKILLMCEGKNEETIMELLLDNNKLNFTRNDLIGLKPYNIRGLDNPFIKSELRLYNKEVLVYRIGDTQTDKLKIPNDIKHIVKRENIFKYCTKPELEILLIINENLYQEYIKSKKTPKTFAKENIVYQRKYYDQSSEYLKNYYGTSRIKMLVDNLYEYKRLKKHNKDELFLADLVKEKVFV